MTNKDYEELKERLLEEGYIFKPEVQSTSSKRHSYFRKFNDFMTDQYKSGKSIAGYGPVADHIKNIIKWAYNAKSVEKLPDDCCYEANQLCIDIAKQVISIHEVTHTGLRECPFCGGTARIRVPDKYNNGHWSVICNCCRSTTSRFTYTTKEDAVFAWNSRSQIIPRSYIEMLNRQFDYCKHEKEAKQEEVEK